jgi:cytochrome c553
MASSSRAPGEAGISTSEHYPNLAGQNESYLRKQLADFQSGARQSEIMNAMASELSKENIASIAAYFARAPAMGAAKSDNGALGQSLFDNGDETRALPPCAACHGGRSKGGTPAESPIPVLAGQRESYLIAQLWSWKADNRTNSPGGVMNAIGHALTDTDIDALAKYLAGSLAPVSWETGAKPGP